MERFAEKGVSILTGHKVVSINEKGVQIVNLANGQEETVDGDRVIIAMGSRPVAVLTEALEGRVPELHSVGDCNQPRDLPKSF